MLPEILGGLLTADAVVALEHERRVPIPLEELIVIGAIEQARANGAPAVTGEGGQR